MVRRGGRLFSSGLIIGALLCMAGCGGSASRPSGEAVAGTVTFDGAPLDRGVIQFKPLDPKGLFASAEIIDGKYSIPAAAGPQPGKFRVDINAPEGGPIVPSTDPIKAMEQANAAPPKERLPKQYNDASTLTAEIKPGTANTQNFELKSAAK